MPDSVEARMPAIPPTTESDDFVCVGCGVGVCEFGGWDSLGSADGSSDAAAPVDGAVDADALVDEGAADVRGGTEAVAGDRSAGPDDDGNVDEFEDAGNACTGGATAGAAVVVWETGPREATWLADESAAAVVSAARDRCAA
jgi:hypothetical protein